jgi:LEA14-like dessication related protein
MRKPNVLPVVLVAVIAGLCGCATLQQLLAASFIRPTLTFKTASLADLSLGSATINLTYLVENPNPIGLELASVEYAFFVEGKQVVAGKPPAGLRIPADGQAEVVLPANVRFMDIVPVLETFLTKDQASYTARGALGVDTPIGVVSLPFEKEGSFDVPKLPAVEFQAPRVTRITLTSATIEVPLTVTNRNGFPLPIGGLSGDITLAGARVGSLSTGDLGMIDARAARPVALPLTIHFAQAAAAAAAIQGGSTTLAFNGTLQSGPISLPLSIRQNVTFTR